jgi:translation initiation factor IF-2
MSEVEIGVVRHFFDKISVALIDLSQGGLAVGDTIHIKGHSTDVTSTVESIRIEQASLTKAEKGQAVGVKVGGKVREHDKVFTVIP